jgi:addiction module RelE/StbE family toxin
MAFQVIWSRQAREDLQEIVTFIALDNPRVAETFGYLLMSKVDVLEKFPLIGRVVPELHMSDLREIIFRSYRIVYQVRENEQVVAIVRIWHGARGEPEIPKQIEP